MGITAESYLMRKIRKNTTVDITILLQLDQTSLDGNNRASNTLNLTGIQK